MRWIALAFAIVSLTGCASSTIAPGAQARADAPLVCTDKDQCARYWKAAQDWLTKHSDYKIKTVSENEILTEGPAKNTPELAFYLAKAPTIDGTVTIKILAGCDNSFGCRPNAMNAIADLKDYVRSQ